MPFNKARYVKNNFIDFSLFNYDSVYYQTYTIPLEFQYRPDVISYMLYGDCSYQTLLSYINRIKNSPEGYYAGRVITIIKPSYIDSI